MRIRTRSLPEYIYYVSAKSAYGGISNSAQFSRRTEGGDVITDDPTPGDGEKDCLHSRYRERVNPLPLTQGKFHVILPSYGTEYSNGPYHRLYVEQEPYWRSKYPSSGALRPSKVCPTLAEVPDEVKQRAFEHMLPHVNDGMSIVNTILELKDLRRMVDLDRLGRLLKQDSFNLKELSKIIKSNTLEKIRSGRTRGLRKDVANDFLGFQFGWKPFISDIQQIWASLKQVENRLQYLEAYAGRVVRRHSKVKLDVPTTHDPFAVSLPLEYYMPFIPSGYSLYVKDESLWSKEPVYAATMIFKYTLPRVGSIRRKIRAFLDYFGVRFDPSIVWNAIPFSFVIDWVVDVGGFLRSFSPTDLGMEIEILDYSHSVSAEHVAQVSAVYEDVYFAKGAYTTIWDYTESYYERAKTIPSFHVLTSSIPGLMQASLGGALAISHGKGRKRR